MKQKATKNLCFKVSTTMRGKEKQRNNINVNKIMFYYLINENLLTYYKITTTSLIL